MASLVDTNVLVYRFDFRFPDKKVLYPTDGLLRLAVRGVATYGLNWFESHMWAYAEFYGLPEILSEDFKHDRLYGTVRAVNPFLP